MLWIGTSTVRLITGASSGLGRALAETALEQRDRVVATARDPSTVADLEDRCRGRAIATRLDVTDPSQARAAGTKFAVDGLMEGLAKDLEHLSIRVTIVEPGPVRTDFAAGAVVTPPSSDDYADSVGTALEWFAGIAGHQPSSRA